MVAATTTNKSPAHPEPARHKKDDLADIIEIPPQTWQDPDYNAFHYAKAGLLVGMLAGCTSLVLNVIGSVLWPAISGESHHPLWLIQVYLTFPLGESALTLNNGVLLAFGCLLYLATGMLYGMAFILAMSYFFPNADLRVRLVMCSVLALLVWAINFYLVLAWIQPVLLGGRWIAALIPWWVAALTHLVYGWTVAALYPT